MSDDFCETILSTLKNCLPNNQDKIALHEPFLGGNEWAYVKECLDTRMVSSIGGYVDKFESMLSEYTGIKYAIAAVNGTAALHISLILSGVKPGDEVLLPALTFVATANAVCYCGAIPHFVDSEEKTLGLDPQKLEIYLTEITEIRGEECFNRYTNRPIRVVIPMHTFGHPVDLDPIAELCMQFKLTLVEDAAESLGSFYKGRHTGQWGKLSVLSFNGNKTITTGGGGAILVHDERLAKRAKHLTTTARLPYHGGFFHDEVGYNYRLPNINAALGCAQLEQLPEFLIKKRALAARYHLEFKGVTGVQFFTEPDFAQSNYWLNVLLLDDNKTYVRDALIETTNANGIVTRPAWTLMHKLPMFKECPRMDLSTAESLEKRLINIPSSTFL